MRIRPGAANTTRPAKRPKLSRDVRLLLDASVALSTEHDLDALLRRFTDIACQLTNARYGALFVEDIGTLVTFVTHGISEEQTRLIGDPPSRTGLHGQLLREGRTVVIDDLNADPRATGYPQFHPAMRTFLGTPIRAGGRPIGELYLADKCDGARFDEADVEMLEALASCAGVAYSNARLLQMYHRSAIHAGSLLELRDQGRANDALFWGQVWAREEERARLARDIHDEQGQILTSLILFAKHLEQTAGEQVAVQVTGLRQLAEQALRAARSLAQQLRPLELDQLGLVPALTRLAEHIQERCGVVVDLVAQPGQTRLDRVTEAVIYRIAQEALTNVARYAQARSASVTLSQRGGWLTLIVEDDGVGFDLDAVLARVEGEGHVGLRTMRERAGRLGGQFAVESRPGSGTLVQLRVPAGSQSRPVAHAGGVSR